MGLWRCNQEALWHPFSCSENDPASPVTIDTGALLYHRCLQHLSLCLAVPLQDTGQFESMLDMVNVLLELGGDLSRVNVVGNDFVAIAGKVTAYLCHSCEQCDTHSKPPSRLSQWS